jgi:hypothetical protein
MEELKEKLAKHLGKTILLIDDQIHFLAVHTAEDVEILVFRKSVLYAEL